MNFVVKIALASALLGVSIATASGIALARDGHHKAAAVFGPAQGISFDVGSKRAIGYYTAANGRCSLTLMLAEAPDADGFASQSAARFKVSVQQGGLARVDTAEGKSLEFGCGPSAAQMTVRTLEQVAAVPARF